MKKDEKKETKIQFGTATNTSKNAGVEGALKLKEFIRGKFGKDPDEMTRAEKRAFRKMAKELLEAGKVSEEEYKMILEALK